MIKNDQELKVTQERIRQFELQVAQIRKLETNRENYRLSAAGFLAEIDRMNLEVRDYLWSLPAEELTAEPINSAFQGTVLILETPRFILSPDWRPRTPTTAPGQ